MPTIYEPTLIKGANVSPNNGADNAEIEFSFGINEGAKIEKVSFLSTALIAADGQCEYGLNFRPNAGDPAAAGDLLEDDDVFAGYTLEEQNAAGSALHSDTVIDLKDDSVYIVKDITMQGFGVGAGARYCAAKVYYKRVRFSDAEMGSLLRNY